MKTSAIFSTFMILIFMVSCTPQKPRSVKASSKLKGTPISNPSSGTPSTESCPRSIIIKDPSFASDESLYWFSGQKVQGNVTINRNNQTSIFLRGASVHNFLTCGDKFKNQYCMVLNYPGVPSTGQNTYLKVRAVPVTQSNYSEGTTERMLRLDLAETTANNTLCSGAVGSAVASYYSNADICPTCRTIISSSQLDLYKIVNNTISSSTYDSSLNLSTVGVRIDTLSNSTTPISTCSDSSCQQSGYDCCSNGQCLKDGAVKSDVNTSSNDYLNVINELKTNPLAFLNYPNYFYICPNVVHKPYSSGETTSPVQDATNQLASDIKDWKCLIGGALTSPDYSQCQGGANASAFITVRQNVWLKCGCTYRPTPTEPTVYCPDYGLKPIYNSSTQIDANISSIICDIPAQQTNLPLQYLGVTVSGKTAPHRFFKTTDGSSIDDYATIMASASTQEGQNFGYTDEISRSGPEDYGGFNMNSILGRIDISLNKAKPAKVLTVDVGENYIVRGTRGYFTPCPDCAKDFWLTTFSAWPQVQGPSGLQASGFTTERDGYRNNFGRGNYEDTIFGRACFVPPTMIAFSHAKNSSVQTQRFDRLKTQATYFTNGYQRDWYGFNRGALIGSFDGVTWFAIGTGRRITATSNKLFLAINAPFADLASPTDLIVDVVPDNSNATAASYDYDYDLKYNDPKQNSAATCQNFHQCETDTDCITKLGWEYACADVSEQKTQWPQFDTSANEKANLNAQSTIISLLQGGTNSTSSKRCVYRGSGAPCVTNIENYLGQNKQKLLACAPNFYCESVANSRFNKSIARTTNEFDNILYGHDANVLGRPLNYINFSGGTSLPTEAVTNIKSNLTYFIGSDSSSFAGICLPGRLTKATSGDYKDTNAHKSFDSINKNTDYISQVGGCDPKETTGIKKVDSCPEIGDDGNIILSSLAISSLGRREQNSCGGESYNTNSNTLSPAIYESIFKNILGSSLSLYPAIDEPKLANGACMRRAGAVCHTDLECSPNIMHANIAATLSSVDGTEAEKKYWEEYLICGQGKPQPQIGAADYDDYDLSENRCCRPIGQDLTMYTSTDVSSSLTNQSPLIPDFNYLLNSKLMSSRYTDENSSAKGHYSRYISSVNSTTNTPELKSSVTNLTNLVFSTSSLSNQWKPINKTGSKTCCGGGFIRKFADGTHDWTKSNKLNIDPSIFKCLNKVTSWTQDRWDYNRMNVFPTDFQNSSTFDFVNAISGDSFKSLAPELVTNTSDVTVTYDNNATPNKSNIYTQKYNAPYYPEPVFINDYEKFYKINLNGTANANKPSFMEHFIYNDRDSYLNAGKELEGTQSYRDLGATFTVPSYMMEKTAVASGTSTMAISAATNIKKVTIQKYTSDGATSTTLDISTQLNTTECNNIAARASAFPNINIFDPRNHDDLITSIAGYSTSGHVANATRVGWFCITTSTPTNVLRTNQVYLLVKAPTIYSVADAQVDSTIVPNNIKYYIDIFSGADPGAGGTNAWVKNGIYQGTFNFTFTPPTDRSSYFTGGSPFYYLRRLGQLELLGIPQISYEPLYCTNNNPDERDFNGNPTTTKSTYPEVDLFNLKVYESTSISGQSNFYSNKVRYSTNPPHPLANDSTDLTQILDTSAGATKYRYHFQDAVQPTIGKVFSSKDFTCCTPLGKENADYKQCCSGYGVRNQTSGKYECKLPAGTDLNVYFNRYVSNEGSSDDEDEVNKLSDDDFLASTGEPKFTSAVYQKIMNLGTKYCRSGQVVGGSLFGNYPFKASFGTTINEPPQQGIDFDFNDIMNDPPVRMLEDLNDTYGVDLKDNNRNWLQFMAGRRWNHHYYCN